MHDRYDQHKAPILKLDGNGAGNAEPSNPPLHESSGEGRAPKPTTRPSNRGPRWLCPPSDSHSSYNALRTWGNDSPAMLYHTPTGPPRFS